MKRSAADGSHNGFGLYHAGFPHGNSRKAAIIEPFRLLAP